MGKLKLNLTGGAIVEKPLICAFKASDKEYVVLDEEMNGSMGLPIILVCKYENNKLTKILDQNEWQTVKEYLKNIIAGGQIEFISLANELSADDVYYTQLTLPVPSFDALKSAYKVEGNETVQVSASEPTPVVPNEAPVSAPENPTVSEATPVTQVTPEVPTPTVETSTPVDNVTPQVTPAVADIPVEPVAPQNEVPVTNTPEDKVSDTTGILGLNFNDLNNTQVETPSTPEPSMPNVEIPVIENKEVTPVAPEVATPITPETSAPVTEIPMPEVAPTVTPTVEASVTTPATPEISVNPVSPTPDVVSAPTPEVTNEGVTNTEVATENVFQEQKEAFMQACENMFDALVQKFEKELENHK